MHSSFSFVFLHRQTHCTVTIYNDKNYLPDQLNQSSSEAFEYLFKTYYPRLRNYALRFVSDSDIVEDILQESYLKLWERRGQLQPISIQSLLFTIVPNGCLNYLEHKVITRQMKAEYMKQNKQENERLYLFDFTDNADQQLLYEELKAQIDSVFESLPERSKEIFLLSRRENLKNREIAEQLGISIKMVERHISRVLHALHTSLKDMDSLDLPMLLLLWLASL